MINPWDILGWILVVLAGILALFTVIAALIVVVTAVTAPKKDKSTHIIGGDRE